MYLAQSLIDLSQLIKALNDAGITGGLLVIVIALVIGFLIGRLVLRNDKAKIEKDAASEKAKADNEKAKIEKDAAITANLANAVSILTTNITKLSDNSIEMQVGARKRDEQMDYIIQFMKDNATAAKEQNDKLDKLAAATVSSGDQTRANRENSDNNTLKIITAVEGVPQATANLFIEKFNELEIAISHLAENVSPDSVKTELAQLKIDFEKALENYLKRTTQNDVDLTAAGKRIDELQHPPTVTVTVLSANDGDANRDALDKQEAA